MADTPSTPQPPQRLQISKYPNRRYYDKTRGKHLTLEDLHAAIREGFEVQVTDSKTGKDITPQVLAQIILVHDAPKLSVFPVELLHRLLRSNQQLVLDFTQKYFSGALNAFLESQKKTEQYLRQAIGLESPVPNWTKIMWGPFHPANWPGQQSPAKDAPAPRAEESPPPELAQQLMAMRAQLDELQSRLAQAKSPARGRSKKPRKSAKK